MGDLNPACSSVFVALDNAAALDPWSSWLHQFLFGVGVGSESICRRRADWKTLPGGVAQVAFTEQAKNPQQTTTHRF